MRVELDQDSHAVVTLSFVCDDVAAANRLYALLNEQVAQGRINIIVGDARPVLVASTSRQQDRELPSVP